MNLLRQTLEAARQAALATLRNRLFLGLLLLGFVASLLGFAFPARLAAHRSGDELFGIPAYLILCQFALPVLATYFGMVAIHQDLVDGSAVHALVAPVPRPCLWLGRAAAVTLVVALAIAALLACYWVVLALPDRPWRRGLAPQPATLGAFVVGVALATPAYVAVGAFVGVTFKRPLVALVLFVVGWEVAISNVPPEAGVRGLTVADPLRRFLIETIVPEPGGMFENVLVGSLEGHDASQMAAPLPSILRFLTVVAVAGLLVFARREYRPRSHGDE
ncbi:MAG: hypothetical protein IT457_13660 [Planctomycetes bacterium]|nr:hypothetical protein [Planctomycetota bacterium]